MSRRTRSIAIGALVTSLLIITPSLAQQPPAEVPETVNIDDPFGDANYSQNNTVTPADAGSISDIGKGWFTNDAEFLYVHLQTEAPPSSSMVGLRYQVQALAEGCLWIDAYVKGSTYLSDTTASVQDSCNEMDAAEVEYTFGEGADGTGLMTWKIPRSYSPVFADGAILTEPFAESWHLWGGGQVPRQIIFLIDNTVPGDDYTIVADEEPKKKKKKKGKNR